MSVVKNVGSDDVSRASRRILYFADLFTRRPSSFPLCQEQGSTALQCGRSKQLVDLVRTVERKEQRKKRVQSTLSLVYFAYCTSAKKVPLFMYGTWKVYCFLCTSEVDYLRMYNVSFPLSRHHRRHYLEKTGFMRIPDLATSTSYEQSAAFCSSPFAPFSLFSPFFGRSIVHVLCNFLWQLCLFCASFLFGYLPLPLTWSRRLSETGRNQAEEYNNAKEKEIKEKKEEKEKKEKKRYKRTTANVGPIDSRP